MRRQEEGVYKCKDYINYNYNEHDCGTINEHGSASTNVTKSIDEKWRTKICCWYYEMADFFRFQKNTVFVAMSNLDRYLGTAEGLRSDVLTDRKQYQLVAMTAFYIAVKVHEKSKVSSDFLAKQSRRLYQPKDFERMEIQILTALKWRINGPTSYDFIQCFLLLLPKSVDDQHMGIVTAIMELATYKADLALNEYYSFECLPSKIALAAIFNSISTIDDHFLSAKMKMELLFNIEQVSGLVIKYNHEQQKQSKCKHSDVGGGSLHHDQSRQQQTQEDENEKKEDDIRRYVINSPLKHKLVNNEDRESPVSVANKRVRIM